MDGIQRLVSSLDGGNDFIRVGVKGLGFVLCSSRKQLMAA